MTSIAMEEERLRFAKLALTAFEEDERLVTYGDCESDTWFAVRWGLTGKAVRVFRISSEYPVETLWA